MNQSSLSSRESALGRRFRVGEWLAEPELHALSRDGQTRHLEPKVMELLVYLASRPERTVAREELLDALWHGRFVAEGVLTRSVFALRQAFADDPREPSYIQTIPKRGYRLVAPVTAGAPPATAAAAPQSAIAPEPTAPGSTTAPASARSPGLEISPGPGTPPGPGERALREAPRRSAPPPSLAVLPFQDLTPQAEGGNEHLAIGLADAIIAELAQLRPLIVRPTSAILSYQARKVSAAQAGRDLGVDAVLDGTFQRSGTRLRVTTQLVSTSDGRSLWGDKIDTTLDDIFQMQDEVSHNIARIFEAGLAGAAGGRRRPVAGAGGQRAGAVYELCLEGRGHLLRETLEECLAAIDCFDRATTADPECALAWAGLADAYSRIAFTFLPEGEWYARAWTACEKALAIDPELPEARYVRGGRLLWSPQAGFDHGGALRDLIPALAARPSLEEAHVRLGAILHHVGLIDEAEIEVRRVLRVSPEHVLARQDEGLCCYTRGDYRRALDIYQEVVRRAPAPRAHYRVALCQLRLGQLDEVAATVDLMERQVPGDILAHPLRGLVAAVRRDEVEARRHVVLTVRNQRSVGHFHHAQYDLACIHALLGSAGEAIAWLAATARNGFPCLPEFERDPFLAALAGDPRYERLLGELRRERDGYAKLYAELRAAAERRPAEADPSGPSAPPLSATAPEGPPP